MLETEIIQVLYFKPLDVKRSAFAVIRRMLADAQHTKQFSNFTFSIMVYVNMVMLYGMNALFPMRLMACSKQTLHFILLIFRIGQPLRAAQALF